MSTAHVLRLALVLGATSFACASKPSAPPERDGESHFDTEEAWTGRVVPYGAEFGIQLGESVSFGPHAPVVRWVGDAGDGVTVDFIVHRTPFEAVPAIKLVQGSAVPTGGCSITLLRLDPSESRKASLSVTCPAPPSP